MQDIFEYLPQNDSELLNLKVNKKLLQQHITGSAGKVVMLKDISNIQVGLNEESDRNDVDALLRKLKSVEGKLTSRALTHMQYFKLYCLHMGTTMSRLHTSQAIAFIPIRYIL